MGLMRCTIKAEAHEAEHSEDNPVYLIQAPIRPEQPVRRFVKSYQKPMHEMAAE